MGIGIIKIFYKSLVAVISDTQVYAKSCHLSKFYHVLLFSFVYLRKSRFRVIRLSNRQYLLPSPLKHIILWFIHKAIFIHKYFLSAG